MVIINNYHTLIRFFYLYLEQTTHLLLKEYKIYISSVLTN